MSWAQTKRLRYKRPFDMLVLTGILLALLPLWILSWCGIILAIWLEDRGSIFYVQKRIGQHGREISVVKFRTMVPNADKIGPPWTGPEDVRLTRVGKVLRRFGIDEMPQIVHVYKGDMSLVGPRSMSMVEHEQALGEEPKFGDRLAVAPGLIGLAVIFLPRACPPRRKLRYDLLYIRKASLWLDLALIIRAGGPTLRAGWGTGARKPEEDFMGENRPSDKENAI